MILIFDLDDTLYEELSYVKSGFKAVSNYLYDYFKIPVLNSYEYMEKVLDTTGRGKIFDEVLSHYNLNNKKNIKKCLSVYRSHTPEISLADSAKRCLNRFDTLSKYIISDGNKIVQKNKVEALGLNRWIKRNLLTHQYGLKYAKPSPNCFNRISEIEKISADHIVHIADNPHKDFISIKPLGFKTIRVLTGSYKNEILDSCHEAHISINSLDEIDMKLLDYLVEVT